MAREILVEAGPHAARHRNGESECGGAGLTAGAAEPDGHRDPWSLGVPAALVRRAQAQSRDRRVERTRGGRARYRAGGV